MKSKKYSEALLNLFKKKGFKVKEFENIIESKIIIERSGEIFKKSLLSFEDDNGKIFETGNILFADLKLRGTNNALYYFDKKGSEGHYDENGKSVKKKIY